LIFGCATILPALIMATALVRETRAFPLSLGRHRTNESERTVEGEGRGEEARSKPIPSEGVVRRARTFAAICQAGLVEKFVDALMWIVLPVYLISRGVDLRDVGWTPGVYAMTWGCSQLLTGPLSDRVGRKPLIVGGMLLCAAGVAALPLREQIAWWTACACGVGLGMGMLYPTLGAAISDLSTDESRGRSLGVYRFWRDLGYAVGAGLLAVLALSGCAITTMFEVVAACMVVSATVVMFWAGSSQAEPVVKAIVET
jgi:MFS family permease